MAVSQDIKSSVWSVFNTLIRGNVSSVTINGAQGPNSKTITIKNISQTFPDKVFDSESAYPMIMIGSPNFRSEPITFRDRLYNGTIIFEVFTNQSESADKIADLITTTIFSNELSLMTNGITEIELDYTDSNDYDRNKIKVHSRMVVFRFKVVV